MTARRQGDDAQDPDEDLRTIFSIADLYDEVGAAVAAAFRGLGACWVRGEIQKCDDYFTKSGHCYLDLVEPDSQGDRQAPVLKVNCWRTTWGPLRALLAAEGLTLSPGMTVVLGGRVEFYRARGQVNFILDELDVTALLGRLAAQRAALVAALRKEGLSRRTPPSPFPRLPCGWGSWRARGPRDTRTSWGSCSSLGSRSRFASCRRWCRAHRPPPAIAAALAQLSELGPDGLDVVALVARRTGARHLAAFDTEVVARAVANSTVPVWTGIGHTGDQSVADLVVARSCITPTECGRAVAESVALWWSARVAGPAARLAAAAPQRLQALRAEHQDARRRLAAHAGHLTRRELDRLAARAQLAAHGLRALVDADRSLSGRAARIGPFVIGHTGRAADRLAHWRRLLAAYDVNRQLERGYSLTVGPAGSPLRSVAGLSAGDAVTTRLADGTFDSVVGSMTPRAGSEEG